MILLLGKFLFNSLETNNSKFKLFTDCNDAFFRIKGQIHSASCVLEITGDVHNYSKEEITNPENWPEGTKLVGIKYDYDMESLEPIYNITFEFNFGIVSTDDLTRNVDSEFKTIEEFHLYRELIK